MVKVEIVEEKEQDSRSPYSSPASSRTSSSVSLSSVGSEPDGEESFYERIVALADIIPPSTRQSISSKFSSTAGALKTTGKVVGNLVWIVTTSALLIGLPLALVLEDEAKIVQQEKEMLAQQQGAQVSPRVSRSPSGHPNVLLNPAFRRPPTPRCSRPRPVQALCTRSRASRKTRPSPPSDSYPTRVQSRSPRPRRMHPTPPTRVPYNRAPYCHMSTDVRLLPPSLFCRPGSGGGSSHAYALRGRGLPLPYVAAPCMHARSLTSDHLFPARKDVSGSSPRAPHSARCHDMPSQGALPEVSEPTHRRPIRALPAGDVADKHRRGL